MREEVVERCDDWSNQRSNWSCRFNCVLHLALYLCLRRELARKMRDREMRVQLYLYKWKGWKLLLKLSQRIDRAETHARARNVAHSSKNLSKIGSKPYRTMSETKPRCFVPGLSPRSNRNVILVTSSFTGEKWSRVRNDFNPTLSRPLPSLITIRVSPRIGARSRALAIAYNRISRRLESAKRLHRYLNLADDGNHARLDTSIARFVGFLRLAVILRSGVTHRRGQDRVFLCQIESHHLLRPLHPIHFMEFVLSVSSYRADRFVVILRDISRGWLTIARWQISHAAWLKKGNM